MQKFYCCGSIKSGTTFLQRLLDLHPKISCKPEQDFGYLFRKLFDLKKNYNLKIKDIHNIMGLDEYLMTDDIFIAGYFKIKNILFEIQFMNYFQQKKKLILRKVREFKLSFLKRNYLI